jgi:hypothetical protein
MTFLEEFSRVGILSGRHIKMVGMKTILFCNSLFKLTFHFLEYCIFPLNNSISPLNHISGLVFCTNCDIFNTRQPVFTSTAHSYWSNSISTYSSL